MRQALALLTALLPGCYLSHSAEAAPDAAIAGACRFEIVDPHTGATTSCAIELGSATGCRDAARCICAAREETPDDVERCVWSETIPRGAITFTDYCTEEPPARVTMAEALEGYLSFASAGPRSVSPECASIPALLGR